MSELQLIQLSNADRLRAFNKIGFSVDSEGYVISKSSKKEVKCKYSGEKVHINTAAILPGSLLIINATPLTMAEYFAEQD